ncbi:GNAT family N-acetyltransferase [Pedobacter yulinensis]|nr:GNAT family N-acetyltransferase [Pedobacter yulinensis]
MKNEISIRPATAADAAALSEMICANAKTTLLPHYSREQWQIFLNYYSPEAMHAKIEKQHIFCAWFDGKIVGTVALENAFVYGFYTRLEYRNMGIGQFMMQHLERFAIAIGISSIELAASPEGLSFYLANGWEKVKDITIEHGGVGFQETLMVKHLESQRKR